MHPILPLIAKLSIFAASPSMGETLPIFECTVVEFEAKAQVLALLGEARHLSLRQYPSGEWLLNIKGATKKLPATAVEKVERLIDSTFTYVIDRSSGRIQVDLKGKPPSRQGTLTSLKMPPSRPELLARVTCH